MHPCLLVPVGLALCEVLPSLFSMLLLHKKSLYAQQVQFVALEKSVLVKQRLLRSSIS